MLGLLLSLLATTPALADKARDRLKAQIAELEAKLTVLESGPAARLADRELARARVWLEQADEARTRRILGLGRLLRDNAAIDLRIAEARVMAEGLSQRRKELIGQVEALERAALLEERRR